MRTTRMNTKLLCIENDFAQNLGFRTTETSPSYSYCITTSHLFDAAGYPCVNVKLFFQLSLPVFCTDHQRVVVSDVHNKVSFKQTPLSLICVDFNHLLFYLIVFLHTHFYLL